MKMIGNLEFPEERSEFESWKPQVIHKALSMRVLCVARTRIEGAWCAYCDAVPGLNHKEETRLVLSNGDKLPKNLAKALFPEFEGVPYSN